MSPFTLVTLVAAAGMLAAVEIVPLLIERTHEANYMGVGPAIVAMERRHYRFSDVGSRGPGFEFVQQGAIRVITPAP